MQTVPIHQAKSQLSELIRAVEQGEEVVLTRHGKRVIRLIREPEAELPSIEARRQAIRAELEMLRAKVANAGIGFTDFWEEHKSERDARADEWLGSKDRNAGS